MSASPSPGSRLSDDLYSLYLAGLGWLVLPFYGDGLSEVLPSDYASIDRGVDIGVAVVIVAAVWFGYRGGPLMVSRAGVLHELASGASRRTMLYPRLLRQLAARSALGAVAGSVILALSVPGEYELGPALSMSIVFAFGLALSVSQSMLWHVVFSSAAGRRPWFIAAALVPPVAAAAWAISGQTFFGGLGLLGLAAAAVGSLMMALLALDVTPIDRLWGRARALETLRSSMQTVDFQKLLLDMRSVSDRPKVARFSLAKPWMPTPVWRQVSALQHGLGGQLVRLGLACAVITSLLVFSDPANGVVALAIAASAAVIGFDLAVPIAGTADQIPFLVHYPRGSGRVLQSQMFTAVGLALVIGGAVTAGEWGDSTSNAAGTLILFMIGTLASLMQARIGSPDVAKMADVLPVSMIAPILWGRAVSGPLLLLGATIAVSHQHFRPDELGAVWTQVLLFCSFALVVVTLNPLEKSIR